MNFKSFLLILITCAYNLCSVAIHFLLFFTSIGTIIASFTLSLHFFLIIWKISYFSKKTWFYNFMDFPPLSCLYLVSIFKCVNIFNINVHSFLYDCVFCYFLRNLSIFLLSLVSAVMDSSTFPSSVTGQIFRFLKFFCFVQFSFHILNHLFSFK